MDQNINSLEFETELWNNYSRKEEWQPAVLDKHNHFFHMHSSNTNIADPIVSRYLLENILFPRSQDGKQFAPLCLTHDVDEIYDLSIRELLSNEIMLNSYNEPLLNKNQNYVHFECVTRRSIK